MVVLIWTIVLAEVWVNRSKGGLSFLCSFAESHSSSPGVALSLHCKCLSVNIDLMADLLMAEIQLESAESCSCCVSNYNFLLGNPEPLFLKQGFPDSVDM